MTYILTEPAGLGSQPCQACCIAAVAVCGRPADGRLICVKTPTCSTDARLNAPHPRPMQGKLELDRAVHALLACAATAVGLE